MRKTRTKRIVDQQEFHRLTRPLLGLPISHVWRGHGSAIFLEIGRLLRRRLRRTRIGKSKTKMQGQYGVMIEWSWRVERPRSIYFGSWSTEKVIESRLPKLEGHIVTAIRVEGRLPELVIELSGGVWIHSFATSEGQTEWCLFLDRNQSPREWLLSRHGKLVKETGRAR